MKLKLGVCILLLSCLYNSVPAQNSQPLQENTASFIQETDPIITGLEKKELELRERQKQLELLIEKNERKIFKLQTYLYISFVLLLIVSLSTLFFWKTNRRKITQLKIENESNDKQRSYRKTDSAVSSLTKFALQEESGTVKSVKDELIYKLSRTHPSLTDKDHQLCTLLMLNLSSKEIASILNIQEESVEKSRSRLRKKMNLDSNQNFIEYFNSIK